MYMYVLEYVCTYVIILTLLSAVTLFNKNTGMIGVDSCHEYQMK